MLKNQAGVAVYQDGHLEGGRGQLLRPADRGEQREHLVAARGLQVSGGVARWSARSGCPPEQAPAARHGGRSLALAVLCTILFLTFLDNTVVSVGLGSVQIGLKADVTALQWVVSAYALTFAAAMLAFGMVSDEFGRKRVMLIGAADLLRGIGPVGAGARTRGC